MKRFDIDEYVSKLEDRLWEWEWEKTEERTAFPVNLPYEDLMAASVLKSYLGER